MKRFLLIIFLFALISFSYAAPPTFITITSPQDGSYINRTVLIEAELTQIPQVRSIKFYIDNQLVGEDTTSPYQYTWDTTAYPDGQHQIYASVFQGKNLPPSEVTLPLDSQKIYVTVDNTPPSGTIKINNDTQYTNSPQVTLNISAQDLLSGLDKMQFSNDDITYSEPEDYSTTKSWIVPITDGEKTVYAKFKDKAGNWSSPFLDTIILDTTAPTINITSPSDGSITTTQTITVSGTTDDNLAQININGIQAQVSNGAFTAEGIDLTLGQNTITATATDLAGNTSTYSITVTYLPTTGLFVDITSPSDGAILNSSTITVSGFISDNTATVTVNGIAATVSNNTFYASITLTKGITIITAEAIKDTQTAEDTIEVILDQDPPAINILTPDKDSTTKSNIVFGRVTDDTAIVKVNGIQIDMLDNSRFLTRPTLTEGQNTITVIAQDKAGNTNQITHTFTYNTTTPKVTITSPLDNSEINISPIKVEGTNATDLKYILIGSLPARIKGTNFNFEGITLISDYTVITAEGHDANDNLFEDSVFVKSPQLANYQFTEVSGDTYEYDDTRPVAGSLQTLKVKLKKNNQLALNEEIQFSIIEGSGALSQSSVFTDNNGDAQVVLTTDTNSNVINKVECFVSNNPLVRTTFVVYTKPGSPSSLTKVSDDSITPVPGATVDLIVRLTDSNNNPIPNENVNFQITQGTGTLSTTQAATASYGEAKVTLTVSPNPNETTQVTATSATNPNLSVTFNITTSQATALTFGEVMAKVNENGNRIQDFMADVIKTSNEPGMPSEERYKIWQKGSKTKIQLLYPEQRTYIIERTENSINLNGIPFLTIEDEGGTAMTTVDSIESFSGDVFVLKRSSISPNFQQITKIYVDYSRGVITKVYSEYFSDAGKGRFEEERSYILIDEIWVTNNIIKKTGSFIDSSIYTTTEDFSNIMLNSGISDSVFQ